LALVAAVELAQLLMLRMVALEHKVEILNLGIFCLLLAEVEEKEALVLAGLGERLAIKATQHLAPDLAHREEQEHQYQQQLTMRL
jgi:hypothetical protein